MKLEMSNYLYLVRYTFITGYPHLSTTFWARISCAQALFSMSYFDISLKLLKFKVSKELGVVEGSYLLG